MFTNINIKYMSRKDNKSSDNNPNQISNINNNEVNDQYNKILYRYLHENMRTLKIQLNEHKEKLKEQKDQYDEIYEKYLYNKIRTNDLEIQLKEHKNQYDEIYAKYLCEKIRANNLELQLKIYKNTGFNQNKLSKTSLKWICFFVIFIISLFLVIFTIMME